MFHFYTPWKCQKTKGFLAFPGGIEMEQWGKMGYVPAHRDFTSFLGVRQLKFPSNFHFPIFTTSFPHEFLFPSLKMKILSSNFSLL